MPKTIQRYSPSERAMHWILAVFFFLAALSGLAFFHPSYFFLSNLFGGGPWARILHPFLGVVMFVAFFVFAARIWNENKITDTDRAWMKRVRDVIANRDEGLPEVGKYNCGQKYLFWTLVVSMLLLIATGFVMWQPYFAAAFPVLVVRIAVVIHAIAAFVLILGIIVHIYSAIWVKGSIHGMTRGTVTDSWARHHHAGWHRDMTRK